MLVAGEPGIGKSTLLLDVAGRAAREGPEGGASSTSPVRESAAQVRTRAERIEAMARTPLSRVGDRPGDRARPDRQVEPELVIVDSVQTISSGEIDGAAGNVGQVREVAAALIQAAKVRAASRSLLVGHVTRTARSPSRVLEHLVDIVVQFEGDRHSRLRLVHAVRTVSARPTRSAASTSPMSASSASPAPVKLFLQPDRRVPGHLRTVTLEGGGRWSRGGPGPRRRHRPAHPRGHLGARPRAVDMIWPSRARPPPIGKRDVCTSTDPSAGSASPSQPATWRSRSRSRSAVTDRPVRAGCAFGEVGPPAVRRSPGLIVASPRQRLELSVPWVPRGVLGAGPVPPEVQVVEVGTVLRAVQTLAAP